MQALHVWGKYLQRVQQAPGACDLLGPKVSGWDSTARGSWPSMKFLCFHKPGDKPETCIPDQTLPCSWRLAVRLSMLTPCHSPLELPVDQLLCPGSGYREIGKS